MHWCIEETMMLMSAIPMVAYLFRKIQTWFHINCACKHKHEGE